MVQLRYNLWLYRRTVHFKKRKKNKWRWPTSWHKAKSWLGSGQLQPGHWSVTAEAENQTVSCDLPCIFSQMQRFSEYNSSPNSVLFQTWLSNYALCSLLSLGTFKCRTLKTKKLTVNHTVVTAAALISCSWCYRDYAVTSRGRSNGCLQRLCCIVMKQ